MLPRNRQPGPRNSQYDTIPRNFARTRGRLDASAAGARDRHRARESGPDHGPDCSTAVVGDSTTGRARADSGSDGPCVGAARRVAHSTYAPRRVNRYSNSRAVVRCFEAMKQDLCRYAMRMLVRRFVRSYPSI